MTLREVIQQVRHKAPKGNQWLFVKEPYTDLNLDSEAALGKVDEDTDEAPPELTTRGLTFVAEMRMLRQCIELANELSGSTENYAAAADVIRYHVRFNTLPDRLNAPDPPSEEERILFLDREFYDKLGPENTSKPCRTEGCTRSTVRFSVLCRPHHFESVKHHPCPFTH